MSTSLFCKLVTPESCLIAEAVWQVTVPGSGGRFSIRRDHAPVIASLHAGELEIAVSEKDRRIFKVDEGIVYCGNNRCTILCPSAAQVVTKQPSS